MKKQLRIFEYVFDERDLEETFGIALVKQPAIQKFWRLFARSPRPGQSVELTLAPTKLKGVLFGALVVPNQNIYRRDAQGEYVVRFSEDDTWRLYTFLNKRLLDGGDVFFNLEHRDRLPVKARLTSVVYKQDGDALDGLGYDDYPAGSVFIAVKLEDPNVLHSLAANGKIRGFSLQMMCGLRPTGETVAYSERNNTVVTKLSKPTYNNASMNRLLTKVLEALSLSSDPAVKAAATQAMVQLAASELALADGRLLVQEEDGTVYLVTRSEEGDMAEIAPAGEHQLADGRTVKVVYTLEIVEPAADPTPDPTPEPEPVATAESELAALRAELAEVKARLAKNKPAPAKVAGAPAKPAHAPNTLSNAAFLNTLYPRS